MVVDRKSRRKVASAPLFGRHAATRHDSGCGGSAGWTAATSVVVVAAAGAFYWLEQRQVESPEVTAPALPELPKSHDLATLPPTTVPRAETSAETSRQSRRHTSIGESRHATSDLLNRLHIAPVAIRLGRHHRGPPKVKTLEPVESPGNLASVPPTVDPPSPPKTVAPLPVPDPIPAQPAGQSSAVVRLSLSPDGRSFMSAGTDQRIQALGFRDEEPRPRRRRTRR